MRKVAGANFGSDSEEMLILITNAWQLGECSRWECVTDVLVG